MSVARAVDAVAPMTLPTGEQLLLAHGDQRAVVTEVGATLREYVKGGVAVVEGFGDDEMATGAPRPAVLPVAEPPGHRRVVFSGREAHAPLDEPAARQRDPRPRPLPAVLGRRRSRRTAATLSLLVHPEPGFPFLALVEVALPPRHPRAHRHDDRDERRRGALALRAGLPPVPRGADARRRPRDPERPGERRGRASTSTDCATGATRRRRRADLDWREPAAGRRRRARRRPTATSSATTRAGRPCGWPRRTTGTVELSVDRTFPYFQVYTGDTLAGPRRRTRGRRRADDLPARRAAHRPRPGGARARPALDRLVARAATLIE